MKIVVDLDGTICETRRDGEAYTDIVPIPGAVEALKALYAAGHTIVIYTARHMATCNDDVAKVIRHVGHVTLDWLDRYEVPYSEVIFGKPLGDVYIDDRAMRFETWETVMAELLDQ